MALYMLMSEVLSMHFSMTRCIRLGALTKPQTRPPPQMAAKTVSASCIRALTAR